MKYKKIGIGELHSSAETISVIIFFGYRIYRSSINSIFMCLFFLHRLNLTNFDLVRISSLLIGIYCELPRICAYFSFASSSSFENDLTKISRKSQWQSRQSGLITIGSEML